MRPARWLLPALAVCAFAMLASATRAATPYDAKPVCDGVHLRTGPSTSYPTRVSIDHTTRVTVAAEVAGSRWSTLCGGNTYAGSKWAKITAIDGVPTTEGYGVKALYTALGLLVAVPPTAAPPTAPPTVAPSSFPPSAVPPTIAPPSATPPEPTASPAPTGPPSASPDGTAAASASPGPGGSRPPAGAGSASTFDSAGGAIALVLALVSVFLAGFALGDRWRRDHTISKVPSSRLNDVLE